MFRANIFLPFPYQNPPLTTPRIGSPPKTCGASRSQGHCRGGHDGCGGVWLRQCRHDCGGMSADANREMGEDGGMTDDGMI